MDVMQAIKERRSIRKYRNEPVSDEDLHTILEAARWAPSWANTQCWRLIIIREQETKARLAGTLISSRPSGLNPAAAAVRNAPVVIVACAERWLSGYYRSQERLILATDKGEWWFMFDVGLAMQNVTLAAHALGLGTVHVGLFDAGKVASILGIPENIAIVELMPLGWPDTKPPTRSRKDISEFVCYEKYHG